MNSEERMIKLVKTVSEIERLSSRILETQKQIQKELEELFQIFGPADECIVCGVGKTRHNKDHEFIQSIEIPDALWTLGEDGEQRVPPVHIADDLYLRLSPRRGELEIFDASAGVVMTPAQLTTEETLKFIESAAFSQICSKILGELEKLSKRTEKAEDELASIYNLYRKAIKVLVKATSESSE